MDECFVYGGEALLTDAGITENGNNGYFDDERTIRSGVGGGYQTPNNELIMNTGINNKETNAKLQYLI